VGPPLKASRKVVKIFGKVINLPLGMELLLLRRGLIRTLFKA